MADINSFFSSKNTVNNLSEKESLQINNYIEAITYVTNNKLL